MPYNELEVNMNYTIIEKGNGTHKEHRMIWVGAEKESLILKKNKKKGVESIGDGYACYRYVRRCDCGLLIIEEKFNVM
jgi:hypothetical protein